MEEEEREGGMRGRQKEGKGREKGCRKREEKEEEEVRNRKC